MDLLPLDLDSSRGRRRSLEEALRAAVRAGQLTAGARLPSTRALAEDLGVARATVVEVYEQLVAEGYLTAAQGSGTRVALLPVTPAASEVPPRGRPDPPLGTHLLPGEPDVTSFPSRRWQAALQAAVADAALSLGYPEPRGSRVLREALAGYLARTRGVAATPETVAVFAGTTAALHFLGRALAALGRQRVGVEDPGLPFLGHALASAGLEVVPVPVDDEGVEVTVVEHERLDAVVVSPAHQYPLGMTMSPQRRQALLAWAAATDALVVEDDYDGEFRYDRQPIGALQGLAPERVVYAGTASKALAPGLRLAWLVLPPDLVAPVLRAKGRWGDASGLDQHALASLIGSGALDRHLRRRRSAYRARRDRMLAVLAADASHLTISGVAAGLHLTALTPDGETETTLVRAGARHGQLVMGLSAHWLGEPHAHGLVLGYSRAPEHAFAAALAALHATLSSVFGGAPV